MRRLNLNILIVTAFLAVFCLPQLAQAAPLKIISSPQSTSGFRHNLFHKSYNGGGSGQIKAWFDLDTTKTNTYDPVSGALSAHFNLYNNSSFSTFWGTVSASGNLPGGPLGAPFSNALGGTITYTFNFNGVNSLSTFLNGANAIPVSYFDTDFTNTSIGNDVNSWNEPYLSLWGSGSFQRWSERHQRFKTKYLGTDLVLKTGGPHVPEPATLGLLASGLLGIAGFRRKK